MLCAAGGAEPRDRVPALTAAVQPGSTTVVPVGSLMIAGPATLAPGQSAILLEGDATQVAAVAVEVVEREDLAPIPNIEQCIGAAAAGAGSTVAGASS